jgi:hypothetical protein
VSGTSVLGLLLAGLGLVAALALALAGPFDPVPPEQAVAERATTLLDSARALWRGEAPPPPPDPRWTVDRWLGLCSVLFAAIAIGFAALALARGEPPRVVLAIAALAAGALGPTQPLVALSVVGVAALVLILERLLRVGLTD